MKAKKQSRNSVIIVDLPLFGDMHHISYNEERRRMEAHGQASFWEVRDLLHGIANGYKHAKTKRGQRIAELSSELADLVDADARLHVRTKALVALSNTIHLTNETLLGESGMCVVEGNAE